VTAPDDLWAGVDTDGSTAMPADVEAEKVLLGKLLVEPATLDELPPLAPGDFYVPAHSLVFTALLAARSASESSDPTAIAARMDAEGTLKRIGGLPFLSGLFTRPDASLGGAWHARRIAKKAQLRRVIETATRMIQSARRPDADPAEIMFEAQGAISGLSDTLAPQGPVPWDTVVEETFDHIDQAATAPPTERGIPFGLIDLDRMTSGLKPGQLVFVAARPGMGKTVVATDLARGAAFKHGHPTLMVSLEMSRVEMAKRIIAAEYQFPLNKLVGAQLTEDDWANLARRVGEGTGAPLWMDDTAGQSLASITAAARRLHRQHKLRLLIVDYLQLIEVPSVARAENRQREVAKLSVGLKRLARELGIPVVVCAQLNRGPEQRVDKRPQLADLRESGSLEADADLVLLLHRPDYYTTTDRPGEIDIDLAKNRHGPTGVVTAAAQLHFSRFVDMAVAP
jgi:replicative DNA helicase